ncbi:hypothetical protein ABTC22_18735, partial [Acinetobacter baumannii]
WKRLSGLLGLFLEKERALLASKLNMELFISNLCLIVLHILCHILLSYWDHGTVLVANFIVLKVEEIRGIPVGTT